MKKNIAASAPKSKSALTAKSTASKATPVPPKKQIKKTPLNKQYKVSPTAVSEDDEVVVAMLTAVQEPIAAEKLVPASLMAKEKKKTIKPLHKPVVTPKAPANKKKKVASPQKNGSVDTLYKKGLALLNKGQYELGRETLETFLTDYPQSSLVPNGVYWIGESFYSQKDFRIAIDLFREVVRRFPKSSKARASMLKIGFSYERLNEISDARQYLLKVVELYPKSKEARLARNMLSNI